MEKKDKKFLPLGTVVLLENGGKKVVITGFCCNDSENPGEMYDYSGCVYPEGFISYDQIGLFNHDQIKEICYMGYINEEEKVFKDQLERALKLQNDENK